MPSTRLRGARREEGSLHRPLSSVSAPQHHRLLALHATLIIAPSQSTASSFLQTFHHFPLKPPPLPTERCLPRLPHWDAEGSPAPAQPPGSQRDARAAVSSATKITSRLSTYFRTVPSCRATQPNYSRLLLYLLTAAACVCLAYCTFPCKGLPHSLLCSKLSSGHLPHTC